MGTGTDSFYPFVQVAFKVDHEPPAYCVIDMVLAGRGLGIQRQLEKLIGQWKQALIVAQEIAPSCATLDLPLRLLHVSKLAAI